MERMFIMVKPNGVARGLVGEIVARFERRGFVLRGMRALRIDRAASYIDAASAMGPTPAGSISGGSASDVRSTHRRRTRRPCIATSAE